ncbi:hypothetical protein KFL_001290280 [Klebsormidium nitens]|uniref:Uncharacterized protein n=1 Tax=Klebsormidium nitens TaxID=105231 RepID=A0A1Y1I2G1_KLENI|nr:hypothetical protein KFL_001290280 [Klebsormidium nitens]|eukprot:GAQ82937.1 hypothetical protein KFL_001290280 [Klebsormidium nitens]
MGTVEAVESEIARVNAAIDALSAEIKEAKEKVDRAEAAGNADAANRWFTELQQLRKDKEQLRKEKEQLRDKEARLESADWSGACSNADLPASCAE